MRVKDNRLLKPIAGRLLQGSRIDAGEKRLKGIKFIVGRRVGIGRSHFVVQKQVLVVQIN